jgi:AraC family transcriptional regulator
VEAASNGMDRGADLPDVLAVLVREARNFLPYDPSGAEQRLDRAAALLAAVRSEAEPAPAPASGGLAPWQVLRLKALIEERLGERLPTAILASAVRLSPSHFARAFRTSFDESPHAYVMYRRMARAKRLMIETDMALSEVALSCGLADQAHFSRVFRRLEGDAPSAWRRRRIRRLEAAA